MNAILYVNRTGCTWEYLPHDSPSYNTVYGYVTAWRDNGTAEQVHDLLRRTVRRAKSRREEPSAVAVNARSATLPLSSRAMIHWPIIAIMSRTLTGRTTISRHGTTLVNH